VTGPEATSPQEFQFQLRGSTFTMMVLKVSDPRSAELIDQLSEKVRQAPNFFRNAPLVLDLEALPGDLRRVDLAALVARLRGLDLIAIGVQGGTSGQQSAAFACGLPLLPGGRSARPVDQAPAPIPAAPLAAPPPAADPVRPLPTAPVVSRPETALVAAAEHSQRQPTLFITEPVRSGRQIYAANADLVVTQPVSPGAELLADGSIHVYGALRGRALAGLSGDTGARIFCQHLDAEMVSIAGLYRVNEDLDPSVHKKPAHVYLKDGYLHLEAI